MSNDKSYDKSLATASEQLAQSLKEKMPLLIIKQVFFKHFSLTFIIKIGRKYCERKNMTDKKVVQPKHNIQN